MSSGKVSIGKASVGDYNLDVSGNAFISGTLSTHTIVVYGSNTLRSQGSSIFTGPIVATASTIFTGATVFTSTPAIGNTASTIITIDDLVSTVASLLNQPFTQQAQTYTF
jgi:tetrahydrodipicolinate N-succinyltransferase